MRAGKKTEAEKGKTRPCIVYVKNLKESFESKLKSANYKKPTTTTTTTTTIISTRSRQLRTSKRAHTVHQIVEEQQRQPTAHFKLNSRTTRRLETAVATSSVGVEKRRRNTTKIDVISTVPRAIAAPTPTIALQQKRPVGRPPAKRRNSELKAYSTPLAKRPGPKGIVDSEPKAKMYKQSKNTSPGAMVTPSPVGPPTTIAASRSRRSIKPNPKYASDDIVTPKYVAVLGSDGSSKLRTSKQLFDDDDDDYIDDMHDFIEEDNDDELADVAFNPQNHKSDDDDMSDNEFEERRRREAVPPKRGRGRPPKNPQAIAAAAAAQAARSSSAVAAASTPGRGRGGVTQLQQMRRSIAASTNLARSQLLAGSGVTASGERKLESDGDHGRKLLVTGGGPGRTAPIFNGNTAGGKVSGMPLNKTKFVSSGNNTMTRMTQMTNPKPRPPMMGYKVNQATSSLSRGGFGSVLQVGRQPTKMDVGRGEGGGGGGAGGIKVQKAGSNPKLSTSGDSEVPTFTIVNIDDIISQEDVLISRSSSSSSSHNQRKIFRKMNNNSSNSSGAAAEGGGTPVGNNNSRNYRSAVSTAPSQAQRSVFSSTAAPYNLNSSIKVRPGPGTATKHIQKPLLEMPKPRPRILNAEMGKRTQMKPLMSMGKELCDVNDGAEMESVELSNYVTDINISPTGGTGAGIELGSGSGGVQSNMRRDLSNKWTPNQRRNVLSSTATATNNNNTNNNKNSSNNNNRVQVASRSGSGQDRKLTKLLGETSDDDMLFKKPASPIQASAPSTLQQQRRNRENILDEEEAISMGISPTAPSNDNDTNKNLPKHFPPQTTTFVEEDGRLIKKITCYETWHVIHTPKEIPLKVPQQRTCLDVPLVKLANIASRIKVPSTKWTSKVTLYKVSSPLKVNQTMTIFTGDLKTYNIPEEDRHKYQPSCVLFRRSVLDRSQCHVPYDRAVIFKNKSCFVNIDGKHVNLMQSPSTVSSLKEVEMLIDIVDSLTLSSDMVEIVPVTK